MIFMRKITSLVRYDICEYIINGLYLSDIYIKKDLFLTDKRYIMIYKYI